MGKMNAWIDRRSAPRIILPYKVDSQCSAKAHLKARGHSGETRSSCVDRREKQKQGTPLFAMGEHDVISSDSETHASS